MAAFEVGRRYLARCMKWTAEVVTRSDCTVWVIIESRDKPRTYRAPSVEREILTWDGVEYIEPEGVAASDPLRR